MQRIIDACDDVLENYGGKNIFQTAENSGARVWLRSLGTLKGFYVFEGGCRYIVINDELDAVTKTVVCAHELGHDMLHRELSDGGIRESTLFLENNKTEREANLFAANILISDSDILEELSYHNDASAVSASLGFPIEIIEYKLEILNFKGFKFNCSGVKSDFLK
ncbi:MAG: ImmA/IrrE family metallo-endopeptidase [Oscillospiraceae bacterium]